MVTIEFKSRHQAALFGVMALLYYTTEIVVDKCTVQYDEDDRDLVRLADAITHTDPGTALQKLANICAADV